MPAPKDYLAMRKVDPEKDKLDHGVKGMKWGVRRSSKELKSAKASGVKKDDSGSGKPGDKTKVGDTPKGSDLSTTGETAAGRYYRLQAQAQSGRAGEMNEKDLAFFNARTDALAKINKLNQSDPSWLSSTTKTVLQNTAQKSMQSISDAVATKYLTGPVTNAIKGASTKPDEKT